jgi:DNA primase
VSIPQSFIQELLSRVDVVDIVGRYVQLKKGGANFMGLCPFHGEKSPSFSVSPSKQFYHCFGCGKNGNAISFLMDHAGMGFIEAVKDLAQQRTACRCPTTTSPPSRKTAPPPPAQKQATLTDVLEKAAEAYRKHLRESPRAIGYFKAAACRAKWPSAMAWATPPKAGAAWPACSRTTTTRCWKKAAWSS